MQRRLGLRVALLGRPELVLLDEPTSALDPVGRHDVREIIRELKARGTAVFLVGDATRGGGRVCGGVAAGARGGGMGTGRRAESRGEKGAVRGRVTGVERDGRERLAGFGRVDDEGEWLTFRGLKPERVPELVSSLVAAGARVYAVEPRQETLEDRFLQLLKEEESR